MKRPYLRALLLVVLACLLAPVPLTHGQTKSFAYRLVDVTLIINTDGSLDVTERFTMVYSGGPFTHISRSIPRGELKGISNISVSEGTQPYREQGGEEPGTFAVTQGESTTVDWYFAPVSDQERSFALSYRAEGAVRLDETVYMLRWSAVHPDRGGPVDRSIVSLWFPPSIRPQQASVILPAASGRTVIEDSAMFVQRDQPLPDGQSLDLRVRIPREAWPQGSRLPESADAPVPGADLPVIGALFAVPALGLACCSILTLAVPGALIWLVVRKRRKPSTLHRPRRYSRHGHGYDSDSGWDSSWSSDSSDSGSWSSGSSGSSDSGGSSSDSGGSDGGGSSSSD